MKVSKKSKNNSFVRYNRPTKIMKLFETKSYRSIIKSIATKVSNVTHTSIKTAENNYINMLRFVLKSKDTSSDLMVQSLGLEKAEVEFLSS